MFLGGRGYVSYKGKNSVKHDHFSMYKGFEFVSIR